MVDGDGGSFQIGGELVGVSLNGADERAGTGGEEIVPDDVDERGLHDVWFDGKNGLPAEGCAYGVSGGKEM